VRTQITDLLGIEHPVLQAPMASVATPELAAAVSQAGGLGALGSAMLAPDELRRQAAAVRALTDRPFQLNFFCHRPPEVEPAAAAAARERLRPIYAELGLGEPSAPDAPAIAFDATRLEALLEIRPPVVSFHFGAPGDAELAACLDAGMRVLASATTVSEARELERRGVDAVVAQGAEAGGHRGSFLVEGDDGPVGTLALVPQVVDAVGVPAIAAGGIGDGRALAAALALGAGAAQMGTAFVAATESAATAEYRRALAESQPEGTTISRNFTGRPARALRNRITDDLHEPLPYPAQLSLTMPLRQAPAFTPMWAGQAARLAREEPAGAIVQRVVAQAERVLAGLPR
jgi:nitronate monooxygenase